MENIHQLSTVPMLTNQTRICLHAKFCKKFILSPDTDVYHIGLPLLSLTDEVIVQLSRPSDKELNLLNLHKLVQRDPDLAHIPSNDVLTIIHSIFVCSSYDYVSFFLGIGKSYLFFEKASFIIQEQVTLAMSITHSNFFTEAHS